MKLGDVTAQITTADVPGAPSWLPKLLSPLNRLISAVSRNLTNVSLTDNINCEVVLGRFTHGVAQRVSLAKLATAKSALLLSSDGPRAYNVNIAQAQPQGGLAQIMVTVMFQDPTAISIPCVLLCFPEGVGVQSTPEPVNVRPLNLGSRVQSGVVYQGPGAPSNLLGNNGDAYLQTDAAALYTKIGGAWTAGGSTAPWSLATPPAVPDAANDEFNSSGATGTLPSGWTAVSHAPGASAINQLSAPAGSGSDFWRCDYGVSRPGWFRWQSTNASGEGIEKLVTFDTNDVIYCRLNWDSIVNLCISAINFRMLDSVSGHQFFVAVGSSGVAIAAGAGAVAHNDGGFAADGTFNGSGNPLYWNLPEYFAIVKSGLTCRGYFAQGGTWVGLNASHTFSVFAPDTVVFDATTSGSVSGGLGAVVGVDFFRILRNTTLLP